MFFSYFHQKFHFLFNKFHQKASILKSCFFRNFHRKSSFQCNKKFQQKFCSFERWHWCWWHRYVDDFMMVTDFRCWCQNHYVDDLFRYVGDFLNVLNRSRTSQTCHQHIWSPTSVTNIDVTILKTCFWRFNVTK